MPSLPWQRPNATEAYAAEQLGSISGYLPFPWATWIDCRRRGLPAASPPVEEKSFSALSCGIRATVCQHIWALNHLELFQQAGITDLFWSHATTNLHRLAGIRIHPFPLYPVRCTTHPPAPRLQAPWQRPLLYSFQGAYAHGLYLTRVRDWILELPARSDACLERRREWHYEQAVYRQQVLGQAPDEVRIAELDAQATAYAETLQRSCFALCPSGSGPNSIRLWEALGFGSIPVILSDQLQLPGDPDLWRSAALFVPETQEAVAALPRQLEALVADHQRLRTMQEAGQQLWQRYGLGSFVPDVLDLLRDPHAVLLRRAHWRCGGNPVVLQANSPAELPLQVRRRLGEGLTHRQPLIIQILDHSPHHHLLMLRWQGALQISAQLLKGHPWAISSTNGQLESLEAPDQHR